jgi:uncharacterized protein YbjT (DUF2867 family)
VRTAVVTGSTGFLGPFVVEALRARFPALSLRCVVRQTSKTMRICRSGVVLAYADLRDPEALLGAFSGADLLVNVASLGFDWTENVVRTAQRARIQRAVFVSTTAILTKLSVASRPTRERGEQVVRESGMSWTILRPTMIYGTPDDRNIARLIRFADRSPVIPIVAARALQQPVHVEDVAWAVAAVLAEDATIGRVYNLSGLRSLTLEALVRDVVTALGRRRLFLRVPTSWLAAMFSLWARVGRPPVTPEQLRRIEEDKSFEHDEASRDFGFAPRDFATGVRAEIALMRAGTR